MGDTSFGLLPDFIGCAMVVSLPVGVVGILVGVEIFFRSIREKFTGFADCAVRAVGGIGINDVGAVGVQNVFALDGDVLRHAERDRETFGGGDHGIGDAGVTAGGIEQSFAGGEFSAGASLGYDVGSGTVFDRASGIEPLGFAQDLDAGQIASDAIEAQQRSVANAVETTHAEFVFFRRMCRRSRHFRVFLEIVWHDRGTEPQ